MLPTILTYVVEGKILMIHDGLHLCNTSDSLLKLIELCGGNHKTLLWIILIAPVQKDNADVG